MSVMTTYVKWRALSIRHHCVKDSVEKCMANDPEVGDLWIREGMEPADPWNCEYFYAPTQEKIVVPEGFLEEQCKKREEGRERYRLQQIKDREEWKKRNAEHHAQIQASKKPWWSIK